MQGLGCRAIKTVLTSLIFLNVGAALDLNLGGCETLNPKP